jgi:hypothetical protein
MTNVGFYTDRIWRWVILAVALVLVAPSPAAGQEDAATSAAGFVLDTGQGEPRYVVVTFADSSMTAVDLLRAADLDAVTVEFGGLGEAVCSIDRTGCDVSTCRQRVCQTGDPESPFWQYWEQGDAGTWTLSSLGASHAEVADGDIAAWVWTGTEPELGPVSWTELAQRAGAPQDIVDGEIAGEPAVYASGTDAGASEAGDLPGTLASMAALAVVGMAGGFLVWRQRRGASVP